MVFKKGNIPHKINTLHDVWKKIDIKDKDDCWDWNGAKDKDEYGRMSINCILKYSHRIVYEETHGSIPSGLYILHKCNNPSCCNPNHLYIGTQYTNAKQMVFEHRQARWNRNGQAKLNKDGVLKIRFLYSTGEYSCGDLGKIFGISRQQIYRIIKNKNWKHLFKEE